MRNLIWLFAATLIISFNASAQESVDFCGTRIAAVIVEINGNCSFRENKKAEKKSLDVKNDINKRLLAGQQLQCERGGRAKKVGRVKIFFCSSGMEREIKENAPKWYSILVPPSVLPYIKDYDRPGRPEKDTRRSPFPVWDIPGTTNNDTASRTAASRIGDAVKTALDLFRPRNPETASPKRTPQGETEALIGSFLATRPLASAAGSSSSAAASATASGAAEADRRRVRNKPAAGKSSGSTDKASRREAAGMSERESLGKTTDSSSKSGEMIERGSSTERRRSLMDADRASSRSRPLSATKPSSDAEASANAASGRRDTAADLEKRVEQMLNIANYARDLGSYGAAELEYTSALRLMPGDWRAAFGLGNVYADQRRWEEAEKAYRRVVEANPAAVDAYVALSFVLLQPRAGGNSAERVADAEKAARQAIKLNQNNAVAFDLLGLAIEKRDPSQAEQAYQRALELNPSFTVAYIHYGHLLRTTARGDAAKSSYRRALELARDVPTLILMAEMLQSENRFADSAKPLQRALELEEHNPYVLYLLAKLQVQQKKYSKAMPLLKSVLEIDPSYFPSYYLLGFTYLQMNNLKEAEQIFNRAAEIAFPADRKLLASDYGLSGVGDAYIKEGLINEAVHAYERAVALDPSNVQLKAKLSNARARLK